MEEVLAYRKVQQLGSELTSMGDLNTTIGISDETFCNLLQQEATKQREQANEPFYNPTQTTRNDEGAALRGNKMYCWSIFVCRGTPYQRK
jgi:hypothetical protein